MLGLCCCTGFSLVAVSGGSPFLLCVGFLLQCLLLWSTGFRCAGFTGCGTWAQQFVVPWLQSTGSVVVAYVGTSRTRDQTHIFCIGRQILYH